MTEAELAAIEATFFDDFTDRDDLRHNFAKVVAEVRRLRGLIKRAEDGVCPWCRGWRDGPEARLHDAACPAFTPDGGVR